MDCSSTCGILKGWFAPEYLVKEKTCVAGHYETSHILSRVVVTPLATIDGFAKVFLAPLMALVGVVAMPIIALVRKCALGKDDGGKWMKAWGVCLLTTVGTVAFLVVTGYYIPLLASTAIFVSLFAASICLHVYLGVKAPSPTIPT
ncbi:MAG: hypothetical protein K940chlam9_01785 [Chlamydiae bacterium]|nr:hypothetical protein [Chlamydiota bacterium]